MQDMRITITIPEDLYADIEESRGLIPRSTYIVDSLRRCIGSDSSSLSIKDKSVLFPNQASSRASSGVTQDYSDVIERIGNTMEREVDYEERKELDEFVKGRGLHWNAYKKTLEKAEGSKFKIIHQF